MTTLFNASFAVYLFSLFVAVTALFVRRRFLTIGALALLAAGAVAQTVYMAMRWHEAGRAPFSNMFESLVLFAWTIVVVCLAVQSRAKSRIPVLSAATAVAVVLVLAYASAFESDIKPLMPALQSNWLSVHVFTCFLGYGGFAVSFVSAIILLVAGRASGNASEEMLETCDTVVARTVSFGFLFLSVGIITGAVWANSAWGTYWSWDPKETWSLITWFVYAVYLHCRYMRGWRGKRAAWISIIGFASVIFTYFGVNFLLSGLHSYT